MKLTALHIVALSAALALASCSGDAPDAPDTDATITFCRPLVIDSDDASRANLINSYLPEGESFGVMGYCIPRHVNDTSLDEPTSGSSVWEVKKSLVCPDVLDRAELQVEGNGCFYKSTDDKKVGLWYTKSMLGESATGVDPSAFRYTFVAYYPYDGRFEVSSEKGNDLGAPRLKYTVVYGSSNDPHGNGVGSSDNRIERHPDATTDAMYAITTDHVRASGAVDLKFRHIMSGLSVQLNNYSEAGAVKVNSVTLNGGFYRDATIDFSPSDPQITVGSDLYYGTFQFLEASGEGVNRIVKSVEVPARSAKTAGATDTKPAGTVVLLLPNITGGPGKYLGTDKHIIVKYTFDGVEYEKTVDFDLGRMPQAGTNYRLNINFLGDQILLMLTANGIEYWQEGSDNDIIIN
ncbi:MAG: fimbrillin family protein [Paramuribaculum sp.]|nr:fimbrillin family protein [Paramuribaculum sp.]